MIKFSEVAHLYLGCEVRNELVKINGTLIEVRKDRELEYIKPILRPLSDITEDEMKELLIKWYHPSEDMFVRLSDTIKFYPNEKKRAVKVGEGVAYSMFKDGIHKATGTLSFTRLNPVQTLYLLKQGFDLFGLIDNGEALDWTKLR